MTGDESALRDEDRRRDEREDTVKRSDRDVGFALRSVYTETVNEGVPPELLDLLGKLD